MGLSDDEKLANDMTQTGKFCPTDNYELEQVTGENRYTCHMCGGVFTTDEKGQVQVDWFGGFE